jgi:hypothetical protein
MKLKTNKTFTKGLKKKNQVVNLKYEQQRESSYHFTGMKEKKKSLIDNKLPTQHQYVVL